MKLMHDAAPKIQQEPIAFYCGRNQFGSPMFRISNLPMTECPLYTFPPDAQAEIAKRDARIVELTETLTSNGPEGHNWTNAQVVSIREIMHAQAERIKELSEQCRTNHSMELDSLARERDELAAALAACEAYKEVIHVASNILERIGDVDEANRVDQMLIAIKPDASALKAHDDALIERIAIFVEGQRNDIPACGFEFAAAIRELKTY